VQFEMLTGARAVFSGIVDDNLIKNYVIKKA
jgi:hypothetical protein